MYALGLLLGACCALSVATDIDPFFVSGSGLFNVGEDAMLKCVIKTEEAPALKFVLEWYKRQDKDFVKIGDVDDLQPPFNAIPNKYAIAFDSDRKTKITNLTLSITGVEAVDIGDYKCVVGYTDEGLIHSDILQLDTTPTSVSSIAFKTDASSEGSVMLFNIENNVDCSASSITRSEDLTLAIQLHDGTEVTQSFQPKLKFEWAGAEGLRIPTTFHSLKNKWMPDVAGEGSLSCYYDDAERPLAVQTFKYRRDETASVNCSGNYKVPVRLGDLDVYITCKLHDYSKDRNELSAKWSFMYDDESVHLFTGETKHQRTADEVGDKYTLFMPRVTQEMVNYGKIFEYKLLLTHKDTKEDIAEGKFGLTVDTTKRIASGSARNCYSAILLFSILLFL